jgi:hypothetical protein
MRYELSDFEWAAIKPFLPNKPRSLQVTENAPKPLETVLTGGSLYRTAFKDGATLYPRMLCLVERQTMGLLGSDASTPLVRSRRYAQENRPVERSYCLGN